MKHIVTEAGVIEHGVVEFNALNVEIESVFHPHELIIYHSLGRLGEFAAVKLLVDGRCDSCRRVDLLRGLGDSTMGRDVRSLIYQAYQTGLKGKEIDAQTVLTAESKV